MKTDAILNADVLDIIFETRNKEFTLRLLDKKKVEAERTEWQLINIVAPIALLILIGMILQWQRKRKYAL